jgi:predicted alpha/beta-fold hydrolase
MSLHAWVEEAKLLVFIIVFGVLHFAVHILDVTVIKWGRLSARYLTAKTGFPRPGTFASAAPLIRRSQMEKVVEIHAQNPSNAHQWFGWPIVVPRTRNDDNPLGSPTAAGTALPLTAPIYTNHVSTIVANFKPVPDIRYRREIVQSFDGCDLCVDWAYPEDNVHLHSGVLEKGLEIIAGIARSMGQIDETFTRFGIPPQHGLDNKSKMTANHIGVMSIVPGLMSNSGTTYIRSFVRVALSHGFVVAMVHTRGIMTPLTTPLMFHGGFTNDLRHWAYTHLSREALAKRLGRPANAVIVGFSLGANILARFLAEDGDDVARRSAVVCASAVSAPWFFKDCAEPMARFIQKKTYDAEFTVDLVKYLLYNQTALLKEGLAPNFDWRVAMAVKDVPSFDQHVIVPHHGYKTREHYYTAVSCFPVLHKVKLPLVCIGVADDPICGPPPSSEQWAALCASTPQIAYAELPSGGHLGCLGHPMAELTRQPTPIEALACRSMAHFLVHLSQGTDINAPMHSDQC